MHIKAQTGLHSEVDSDKYSRTLNLFGYPHLDHYFVDWTKKANMITKAD